MKIVRTIATCFGALALTVTGMTAAHADGKFTESGSLSCGAGQVVELNVHYSGQGKARYNISRTNVNVLPLQLGRPNGDEQPGTNFKSNFRFKTQTQSSQWNIWMETGTSDTTANCVSK